MGRPWSLVSISWRHRRSGRPIYSRVCPASESQILNRTISFLSSCVCNVVPSPITHPIDLVRIVQVRFWLSRWKTTTSFRKTKDNNCLSLIIFLCLIMHYFSVRWSMPNKSQNPQVHYFILGLYLGKHRYRMLDFLFYIEIVLGQTQVRSATSSAMSSLLKLLFDEISEPCKFDV
jgi:hypothetical protein